MFVCAQPLRSKGCWWLSGVDGVCGEQVVEAPSHAGSPPDVEAVVGLLKVVIGLLPQSGPNAEELWDDKFPDDLPNLEATPLEEIPKRGLVFRSSPPPPVPTASPSVDPAVVCRVVVVPPTVPPVGPAVPFCHMNSLHFWYQSEECSWDQEGLTINVPQLCGIFRLNPMTLTIDKHNQPYDAFSGVSLAPL